MYEFRASTHRPGQCALCGSLLTPGAAMLVRIIDGEAVEIPGVAACGQCASLAAAGIISAQLDGDELAMYQLKEVIPMAADLVAKLPKGSVPNAMAVQSLVAAVMIVSEIYDPDDEQQEPETLGEAPAASWDEVVRSVRREPDGSVTLVSPVVCPIHGIRHRDRLENFNLDGIPFARLAQLFKAIPD